MYSIVELYRTKKLHMKKRYITTLVSALFAWQISAQVSTYVFTQFSGTYTAISGGTVFGTTTSDDQVFVDPAVPLGGFGGATGPGMPIGFNFTFNNLVFDRIGINNNGWIFFGQSSAAPSVNSNSSSGYTGISATSTAPGNLQNRVAALARDLQAQVGGDLRVQTIGTAPNQICVIQWNNYRKFAATGDSYNFQIRLYETSNVVEVAYGSFVNNATTATAEVGLRGSTNTDFNNRIVNAANAWPVSIAGVANNSNATLNNAGLVPSNGQVYRWTPPSPCSGTPAANSVVSSQSLICPNAAVLMSMASSYTNVGLTYQWFSSTVSAVGPFTPIAGATLTTLNSGSLQANTFYNVAITCTVSSQTTTSSVQGITIAGTTTNSVPYFEGFEDITITNQLPNCSWSVTSPSVICQTYTVANANNRIPRTGSKFASFRFGTAASGDYFYTNGIQMEPGITYSTTLWYITDGLAGWQNLSIGIGTAQAAAAMSTVATLPSVPSGQFYQALTNTFVVQSSGLYYLGIRCVANSVPQFLSFDDLEITIPCSLNAPQVSISSSQNGVCNGQAVSLFAAGTGDFLWSNSVQGPSVTITPPASTIMSVTATNTLTGCITIASYTVLVLSNPPVTIFAPQATVCAGTPATLYAFGADQYAWNTGALGSVFQVSPLVNTTYSVVGSWAQNACVTTATQAITVRALPIITAGSSRENGMCIGETATLNLVGQNLVAGSFSSNNITINSLEALVSPLQTITYTVVGSDNFGCTSTITLTQLVSACTNISENEVATTPQFWPSPTTGLLKAGPFAVKTTIKVMDVTGKQLLVLDNQEGNVEIDLNGFSNGLYYITATSSGVSSVQKVMKN